MTKKRQRERLPDISDFERIFVRVLSEHLRKVARRMKHDGASDAAVADWFEFMWDLFMQDRPRRWSEFSRHLMLPSIPSSRHQYDRKQEWDET